VQVKPSRLLFFMVRETEGLTFNSKSAEILRVERRWERSSNSGHQRCRWLFFFSRTANTIFSSRLFIQYKVSGYCHIESKKNISGNTKWTPVAPLLWSETISLCKKLNIIITCNPESYSLKTHSMSQNSSESEAPAPPTVTELKTLRLVSNRRPTQQI